MFISSLLLYNMFFPFEIISHSSNTNFEKQCSLFDTVQRNSYTFPLAAIICVSRCSTTPLFTD